MLNGLAEAFVSPSDISGIAKAVLRLSLAIALLADIFTRGRQKAEPA